MFIIQNQRRDATHVHGSVLHTDMHGLAVLHILDMVWHCSPYAGHIIWQCSILDMVWHCAGHNLTVLHVHHIALAR